MNNLNKRITVNENSNSGIIDKKFFELINEFILTQNSTINKTQVVLCLTQLYKEIIKNKKLVSKNDSSLLINKVSIKNIISFQKLIILQLKSNIISKETCQDILFILYNFLKFLSEKNIVKIYYKPPNIILKNKEITPKLILPIFLDFSEYLSQKNYTHIETYLQSVKKFLKFSSFENESVHNNSFWKENIYKYEEELKIRVLKEALAPTTAYQYLKRIKVFLNFMYEEGKINFVYSISNKMKHQPKRSNEFAQVKDLIRVIDTLLETSKNVLRDLTILLILVETGCRSIEVTNIAITDVLLKERKIKLFCKKSQQRTLTISDTLAKLLADYLEIRGNYLPHNNTTSLFLTSIGTPIITGTITKIIYKLNLKAFGEIKFSAKTLRHTYITNALNNKNSIEVVADAVGHKKIKTTLYYFYRDINLLKKLAHQKNLNWLEEK